MKKEKSEKPKQEVFFFINLFVNVVLFDKSFCIMVGYPMVHYSTMLLMYRGPFGLENLVIMNN